MTTFKFCLSVCGLSQSEAADFFQVSLQQVKNMSNGRSTVPAGIWLQLSSLLEQIQDAANGAADIMALDGIDPRAYNNIEADLQGNELPMRGAIKAAGAMALLMAIGSYHRGEAEE